MSKKHKDPHAEREAQKYENPIVSREVILGFLEDATGLVNRHDMADYFELTDSSQKEALRRRLRAMERDGQLLCNHKGQYGLLTDFDAFEGVVSGRKNGSGWVTSQTGVEVYLHNKQMSKVFVGDDVAVRITGYHQRTSALEGKIEKVLNHRTHHILGRFYQYEGIGYVDPQNANICHRIVVSQEDTLGAKQGDFVMVTILNQPTARTQPTGKVVKILGGEFSSKMAIELAIQEHHIPHEWPEALLGEVSHLSDQVVESDWAGREDCRELPFVTIDGEDAKDFDDAVFCRPNANGGFSLYVAIADVSHYVRVGSQLDAEAQNRGNSVYFPGCVVPMLPEKLSNGLCSLNPHVDRLTLATELQINQKGEVTSYRFFETVIHSHARLTYTKVADMIENSESEYRETYSSVLPQIEILYQLYQCLLKARQNRGALDFETVEADMVLNDMGEIIEIKPLVRNVAHRIIEECMLCANVAAAEFLLKHKADGVFRIHEPPKHEKIENLRAFLKMRGLTLKGGDTPSTKDVSKLLNQTKERSDYSVLQTVVLRTMNQALYSPDNVGHYGLAYDAYTHFTSPIRRYPDLMVHRVIRLILNAGDEAAEKYLQNHLIELSTGLSHTERRAEEASRGVSAALKCQYMSQHVGDEFEGVITGVTSFGFFVMVDHLYIDGLVHVTSLKKEYYHYHEDQHALIGERSHKTFKLGDRVRIVVVDVKVADRKIDFRLVA